MSTTEPATAADAATLASLEQEREFLLRSLADLDAEYEAGDLEDDDYRSLSDDYTARAAAVLRSIEAITAPKKKADARKAAQKPAETASAATAATAASAAATPASAVRGTQVTRRARAARSPADGDNPRPALTPRRDRDGDSARLAAALQSRRRWRTAAVMAVVLGFGAVAAWAVAQSSSSRVPGQTATGNGQITRTTVSGGIDPRIGQAVALVDKGQVADALKLFDAVLKDDPNQPVALADGGWLEAQAGIAGNRPDLVDTGLAKIVKAEQVDGAFADAHFFRGFLLLRAKNDASGAVLELRTYLGMVDPSAPQVASVQGLLQEAIKAAGPNVPPGPNAATTTTPTTTPTITPTTHP